MDADPFARLHPVLQHHIVNSLGWRDLRPLQRDAIDPILDGSHVLALAPTAGGKTEAAIFPILSQILSERRHGLSTLYLCPLRALLNNLHTRVETYGSYCGIRVGLWHGDTGAAARARIREEPPEILLTTPESLEAMLLSVRTDHLAMFANLRQVVVDEIHAFGGDDRGWHLLGVLERLSDVAGRDLQRIGLSATVGDPDRLLDWLVGGSTAPRQVVAPDLPVGLPAQPTAHASGTAASGAAIEITVDSVGSLANAATVISLLHAGEKRLVFCDSRARVETLAAQLRACDVTTFVSHASLSADERRRAEQAFAEERNCVIVATSTLELGIDVGDLDRVIQIDSPSTVASFLQRLGRTGRRPGTTRNMLFLATGEGPALLQTLGLLHLWSAGYVEPVEAPAHPLHLLAHQILSLTIQEGQLGANLWGDTLGRIPEYRAAIDRGDAGLIVKHLVSSGMLFDDHGMLSIGPEGERSYGYRHFIELTSVFTSPPLFVVRHGANELGSVDPSSLLTNERGYATILLAGRAWKITSIDWARRFAWVEPTDQPGRSRWGGGGQALGARLCRSMRDVASDVDPAGVSLSARAQDALVDLRSSLPFAHPGAVPVVIDNNRARWWTWAGLRANATFAAALGDLVQGGFDDLSVGLDPSRASVTEVAERVSGLLSAGLPTPQIAQEYAENMKFADCLPEALAIEVARRRLLDPTAVAETLAELRR